MSVFNNENAFVTANKLINSPLNNRLNWFKQAKTDGYSRNDIIQIMSYYRINQFTCKNKRK